LSRLFGRLVTVTAKIHKLYLQPGLPHFCK
jgi:hypothetical protein